MCALGLKALEIPTHPQEGISLDALGFAIEQNPVKACLVISNFNNPLGSCIPDQKKKQLVEMLAEREIPLIEVDISGELYFKEPRPSVCKAYDPHELVMLCSSFSKTLCPGYRVGWVAPGKFKSTIEWLRFTSSLTAALLPQLAVAEYLDSGGYQHHMRRVRRTYALNVSSMIDAIMTYFPENTRVTHPKGGFMLWIQLPKSVDSLVLYKHALRAGISLSPGYLFSPSQRFKNFIRLNASAWNEEIERAIIRLGDLIKFIANKNLA
jgi:DNA-binding transcriptional MocR family regulator